MGPHLPISKALADGLVSLKPADRVELALDLWDSLETGPDDADAIAACAQRRLAEFRRGSSAMVAWEDFRGRLRLPVA
jgi:putative addiction module component (TIGR02574 family)